MILDDIISNKRSEIAHWLQDRPLSMLMSEAASAPPLRNFRQALVQPDPSGNQRLRIIAEVKKASPSRGVIREDFDPVAIARTYEAAGAAAVSVLTDKQFFQGGIEYLKQVRAATTVPLLMKDFIIDPYQIYLARTCGADAVLLIAGLHDADRLSEFLNLVHSLGMQALVEVHSEDELAKALAANAHIVGINNRDLRTFKVAAETTRRLAPLIGPGKIVVSESGIDSREVMLSLAQAGVHAFLIGEALMRAKDIGTTLRSFINPKG
jgi:indole-3-glycerol phosphate synthase